MKKIHFSIDIQASKEKVWKVLWDDSSFRDWTSAFTGESKGSTHLNADWKEGGRFEFFESNSGSYGVIDEFIPYESVIFNHLGEIRAGNEIPYRDGSRIEKYTLRQIDNVTTVSIDQDIPDEHRIMFEEATPRAFERIKQLAENQKRGRLQMNAASDRIESIIKMWDGVSVHPHRFGGKEFRFSTRELGHLHGDILLDIPFPKKIRNRLIAEGAVRKHHALPESGWVSFYIREEKDIDHAIRLLRMSYDLAVVRKKRSMRSSRD